jgi:hypothetical protein
MKGSVVQNWLNRLSWKQQTVLLASLRGCDGLGKNDPSKVFTKRMRATLLKNADTSSTFMPKGASDQGPYLSDEDKAAIDKFFYKEIDAYPVHWLMHFLQAAEIVGYQCPDLFSAQYWWYFYKAGVKALHLNPETLEQMLTRLGDALTSLDTRKKKGSTECRNINAQANTKTARDWTKRKGFFGR